MTGHGNFSGFTAAELSRLKGNPDGSFEIRDYRELKRRNYKNEDLCNTRSGAAF